MTFMHYDLGYSNDETCMPEPLENPFGPKAAYVSKTNCKPMSNKDL